MNREEMSSEMDRKWFELEEFARKKELALKEKELFLKEKELERGKSKFVFSPVIATIIAAFIGFMTTTITSYLSSRSSLEIEKQKPSSCI